MKPKPFLRSFIPSGTLHTLRLVFTCGAIWHAGVSSLQASTYYWDSNSTTAGLGDTAGTWGAAASPGWGSMNAGSSRIVISGKQSTANTTIAVGDTVYFGTVDLALGSTASTIGIVGTNVQANRIVFSAGQGAQGLTLSGGGGAITLSNSGASIVANNSGTNTIGAVLNGTTGLLTGGSGTVLLTGANGFTGGVTVTNGGTLKIGNGTSGSLASQNLSFHSGGGTFNVQAANAGSTQAMGTLTFTNTGATAGEGAVISTYGSSGNAELSFSSLATRQGGATGNFIVSGGSNGTTNKIVLTGAATGFLDTGLYFNGSSFAANDAGGFVRGLSYGTDTDAAATNTITASNHVQLTTSPAARPGDTLLSLHLSGGVVNYTMNSGSLTVPAILKTGGGATSSISGGDSLTTAGNAELVVRTDGASDAIDISTVITGFSGGLTKTGAGTLTVSGSNGYTGVTRVLGGTLVLSGGSAIADTQQVLMANAPGATLQLDTSETVANVYGGGFYGGTVNVQGNTLTYASNSSIAFGGTYAGSASGGIVKQGTGTLTLSNKNTFGGSFTLEGGAVEFTYGNDGTGPLILLSSGGAFNMADTTTLRFKPAANLPWGVFGAQLQASNGGSPAYPYGWLFTNDINITSGTASFRVDGNENTIRFTGNVTGSTSGSQTLAFYSGGIAVGSGDRQANTFEGTIQDGAGGTLGVNVDFAGTSGTAQAAFVNLSGQNTFSGPLVVTNSKGLIPGTNTGGYVSIGGERYANTTTFVTGTGYLGGGNYTNTISLATGTTLTYLSSADQTLGGEISGAGSMLKRGSGALTLSAANLYTGTTTVSEGTLLVNNTTGSGTGTGNVTVTAGTLGGTGSISGTVTIGNGSGSADAILAPGTSIESIDTGNLSFLSDGNYDVELNGTSVTCDVTNVTGTVSINASTTLSVNLTGALSASQQYVIVSNDGVDAVTGTFAGLTQDAVVGNYGGTDLKISYTGGDGNDIVLYTEGGGITFADWRTASGAGSQTLADDHDNDGVDNGTEFFLGGNTNTTGFTALPTVVNNAGTLSVTWIKHPNYPGAYNTDFVVETSDTLGSWTTEPTPPSTVTISGNNVTYTFPGGPAYTGKKFARLKVTGPN